MARNVASVVVGIIVFIIVQVIGDMSGIFMHPERSAAQKEFYDAKDYYQYLVNTAPVYLQWWLLGSMAVAAFAGSMAARYIAPNSIVPVMVILIIYLFGTLLNNLSIAHAKWFEVMSFIAPLLGGESALRLTRRLGQATLTSVLTDELTASEPPASPPVVP